MTVNAVLVAAAATALLNAPAPDRPGGLKLAEHALDQCGFELIARAVSESEYWQDLGPSTLADPELADELSDMMPGFELAYLNRSNMGLLLVGGSPVDERSAAAGQSIDYWREAEQETRAACMASGVACEIDTLSDAPYGLKAMTRIDGGDGVFRRETLAFSGVNGCSYTLQFSSPEQALSEPEWQSVGEAMLRLRSLLSPKRAASR